jgi:hypothetical protein
MASNINTNFDVSLQAETSGEFVGKVKKTTFVGALNSLKSGLNVAKTEITALQESVVNVESLALAIDDLSVLVDEIDSDVLSLMYKKEPRTIMNLVSTGYDITSIGGGVYLNSVGYGGDMSSENSITSRKRTLLSTGSSTPNSTAWMRIAEDMVFTGSGGQYPIGGFEYTIQFGLGDPVFVPEAQMFIGIMRDTNTPTNVNPATMKNYVGVAQLETDPTQLYLVYGGEVSQTPIPLGASDFPLNLTTAYELTITSPKDRELGIIYTVKNLHTGVTTTGSLIGTNDVIPSQTIALRQNLFRSNNTANSVVGLQFMYSKLTEVN